jgi:serine/threonine-protein kinase
MAAPGTLVYLPRRSEQSRARSLVWVDRAGREEPVGIESAPFTRASIAPDGAHIALAITAAEGRAIWIYARDRGTLTRLTPGSAADTAPIWTPDGEHVIFRSERDGGGLFSMRADGAGPVTRLSAADRAIYTPYDVTRDGRLLLFTAFRTYRDQGIGVMPLDGSVPARAVVDGPAAEVRPHVSPDGRWVAYQSDESGRFEIYVRPWPAVEEGRWQISARGGTSPRWGPGGRELFFFNEGAIHRATVETRPAFRAGVPAPLFAADLQEDRLGPLYDVSPDGQRFLFIRPAGPEDALARGYLTVVQNWRATRP